MSRSERLSWPKVIRGKTFDEIFHELVWSLNTDPEYLCAPRGQKIKETIGTTLVLTNPRARLLDCEARDPQYGFGVGEFLWYWAAKCDLKTMLYYNKRMKDFSDNGTTLNSAYGYRIRHPSAGYFDPKSDHLVSQWETCKRTLSADSDSRRALLLINNPHDQHDAATVGSKDVPCTLSLQFFIRDGSLHLHTHMRSNDVMWGLTYDLFSFTLLQEMMLLELREAGMTDLVLGDYIHTAGSLHIYERHFEMADAVANEYLEKEKAGKHASAPMLPLETREMARLLEFEEALRTGKEPGFGSDSFVGGARWMAEQLEAHRRKRDQERGRAV